MQTQKYKMELKYTKKDKQMNEYKKCLMYKIITVMSCGVYIACRRKHHDNNHTKSKWYLRF